MKSFLSVLILGTSAHCISAFLSAAPKTSMSSPFLVHTSSCHTRPSKSISFNNNNNVRNRPLSSTSSTALSAIPTPNLATIGTNIAKFYKGWPLVAGFLTASTKASFADRLAQYRDVCTTKFDPKRNIAMVLYSGLILGVSCEIMYNRLFPRFFGYGERTVAMAIKMTLFDGFVNAPFFWLPPAYIAKALVYGYPIKEAIAKYIVDVKENGLLKKYWSLWLPVTMINFMFIPDHFRIAFVAAVSFFWMIILSVVANNDQEVDSCPVEPDVGLLNVRALD